MTRTITLSSLALFAALCGPALCGLVYTANDLGAFHLPLRAFYARALANGDAFDWCGELYGGFYLTGEGQAGTYHPLHWLVYRTLPLSWAWNIECLASYPFAFVGVLLWLRRRGFSPGEAGFGAMAFTFSSFNLLHFVHVNAIAVTAHMPWLFYGIDRLTTRRTDCQSVVGGTDWQSVLHGVSLIAGLTGSQLLLGYPQYVLYTLLAEGLYLLFRLRECKHCGESRAAIKLAALWSMAKLFGLALGAVQIMPTMEALADSVRQGVDSSFSASGSLHPLNIVQLVAPYLFTTRVVGQNTHELGLYVGCVPLLLAVVAVASRCSQHISPASKTVLPFALALVALGGLIALGDHGPLHRWTTLVPFAGYFRFPCRALVLVELGTGLLAAIGFTAIYRSARLAQPIDLPRKVFFLVVLAALVAAVGGPMLWPEYTAADWRIWIGPAAPLIALVFVTSAAKGSRLALHAMVVFTAIDLGVYGLSYAVYRDVWPLEDYIASTPAPPGERGGRVALDLALPNGESLRAGNQILLRGFSRIDGYAGLEPARLLDYRSPAALRVAGVAAVAANAPIAWDRRVHSSGEGWQTVNDAVPRVRLAYSFRASDDAAADLTHIDVAREVLIQHGDRSLVAEHLGEASTGVPPTDGARLLIDRPGYVAIEANASQPAILVLNETYHRGWTAAAAGLRPAQGRGLPVQGRESRALRVNGDFLGCLVPEGPSTVEFRFAPASLRYGRLISVCGLSLIVILVAAATWHRAASARRPVPAPLFRASRGA